VSVTKTIPKLHFEVCFGTKIKPYNFSL